MDGRVRTADTCLALAGGRRGWSICHDAVAVSLTTPLTAWTHKPIFIRATGRPAVVSWPRHVDAEDRLVGAVAADPLYNCRRRPATGDRWWLMTSLHQPRDPAAWRHRSPAVAWPALADSLSQCHASAQRRQWLTHVREKCPKRWQHYFSLKCYASVVRHWNFP